MLDDAKPFAWGSFQSLAELTEEELSQVSGGIYTQCRKCRTYQSDSAQLEYCWDVNDDVMT
ncbi:MAG: hypothetical protein K0R83_1946 [Caulobacter sp.]|nr:hypothetical protein [Caulobacter sp.]